MTVVVVLARLVLAVVFVVSAIAKLRDRPGTREAVQQFGVPAPLVGIVAAGLPLAELVCAALLVSADPGATVGAVAALTLLAAFTVAVVVNVVRGRRFDCHCFGQVGGGSIGWGTVVRNGALLALAGLSLVGAGSLGSVPAELADHSASELLAGAGVAVLVLTIVALAVVLRTLMGRYGAVLLRLEALETVTGLTQAQAAPSFSLPDLDGTVVSLDDVLEQARPVLVAFVSPTCSICSELLPDLAAWQQDPDAAVSVVVVSNGTVQANRTKLGQTPTLRVLLQDDRSMAREYGVQGTPAAVLLGADGRFAAPVAHGIDAIRELHAGALSAVAGVSHQGLHQIAQRPASPGDPLPDVEVTTPDGDAVPVAELVGDDETVLLFWRTTCGFCSAIVDDVAALEAVNSIVLVSTSEVAELRSSGLSSRIVREPGSALTKALQVPGTPSAVLVRAGRLDSTLAVGGPEVLSLLRQSAHARSLGHLTTG